MPPGAGRKPAKFIRRKNANLSKPEKPKDGEFDLEKARHEVFMLGIKGLSRKDKQEAKRELAIRLGAIPKKKRGKNIKRHIDEVREKKRKEQEERDERARTGDIEGSGKRSKTSKSGDKRKKKGLNEVRDMDYQIGRFKNGVQYLSKDDIQKLQKKGKSK